MEVRRFDSSFQTQLIFKASVDALALVDLSFIKILLRTRSLRHAQAARPNRRPEPGLNGEVFNGIPLLSKRVLHIVWALYYIHTVVDVTMNVPKYTSSRQSATGAAKEYQYLNQLRKEDLKMIFLMGPSVKSVSNK